MGMTKNDVKFLDLLKKGLYGKDKDSIKKCRTAIQAFFNKPTAVLKKNIQALSVTSDFARVAKDAFQVFIDTDNFDMGYEKVFKKITLAPGQDSWEIHTVTNGLTFRKYTEGQRAAVEGMSSGKATVYVDKYGGAIGWTDEMIRFRKVARVIDLALEFRNKYWANKADVFYTLINTACAVNTTAYQGVAADGQLQRDIQTINKGCYDIANATKDKAYGDTANARMVLYANPLLKNRIEAAFRATTAVLAAAGDTGDVVGWNVERVYTFNGNVGSTYLDIVLPGHKIQSCDVMLPTTYEDMDILALTYVQAVWAYYGGSVGDTDQCRKVAMS